MEETYPFWNHVSINVATSRWYDSQKPNWNWREDPKTFFDTSIHEWEVAQICNDKIFLLRNSVADFLLQTIQDVWVSQQMVCKATEERCRCFATSNTGTSKG